MTTREKALNSDHAVSVSASLHDEIERLKKEISYEIEDKLGVYRYCSGANVRQQCVDYLVDFCLKHRAEAAEHEIAEIRASLEKLERYTQHLPRCMSSLCKTCNVSRRNGQHEDDHYGANPHPFEPRACTCGLADTLAGISHQQEQKKD